MINFPPRVRTGLRSGLVVCPIGSRCSGDDSVIVPRVTLSLHERFPTAVRTAAEIGVIGSPAVKRLDYAFGVQSRQVNRAVPEVRDLFGMAERPRSVFVPRMMAGIRRYGGVSVCDALREPLFGD
jgi:hypothetical protein